MSQPSTIQDAQNELWFAALHGSRNERLEETLSRIEKVIEDGADPNAPNHKGSRLLNVLVSQGGLGLSPVISALCVKGANPLLDDIVHEHALRFSTAATEMVRGATRGNYKDDQGATFLHGISKWAASGMDEEWVSMLLHTAFQEPVDMSARDNHGQTPLHKLWSVKYSDFDMPEHYIAANQWSITNQLSKLGDIGHLLADPRLLDLIEASGYVPSQCQPEVGVFPVMDQVEALLAARSLDNGTQPSSRATPRVRI
jgi:hypothetical protein